MKTKIFHTLISCLVLSNLWAQPANDNCSTAQVLSIPASGNLCVNSTNIGATSDLTTNTCDTGTPGNEVWFTFITTGGSNTVTVTPNGATPATSLVVSMQNTPCGSGTLNICNASTGAAPATAIFSYAIGTQVWVSVETNGTDGTFEICVNSISQPAAPGNSCATATRICNKNTFTLPSFPINNNIITPSCFPTAFQQPIFYQFTVGQSGTCIWSATPIGAVEYDWVMYDITGGCPGIEVCCNFNFASHSGAAIGMETGGPGACGTAGGAGPPSEFSPPANVVAGNTYLIVIDNYSNNTVGFTMSWGGTFEMAPNPNFTMSQTSGCAPMTVNFTNTSTATVTYDWDLGNGVSSTLATPPSQTYTTPGSYLVNLVGTSASGCTNIEVQTITVNPIPTINNSPNQTHCATSIVPVTTFSSPNAGATFSWTNNNTAIGLGANGTGNLPSFTATNSGTLPIVSTITVTPILSGCNGTPITFTITINPKPVVNPIASITQCANSNIPLTTFTSFPTGATFDWTNTNTAIGLAASGSGNLPTFVAPNVSSTTTSTITVTPTLASCVGNISTFTITINPLPSVNPSPDLTACSGNTVPTTTFTSTPTGATFTWTNSNTAIGLGANGTGNQPAFVATNSTSGAITSNITVTPTLAGCVGTTDVYQITVNPTPTMTVPAAITQCGGTVSPPAFVSNPTGAAFDWTNTNTAIGLGANGTGSIAPFTATNNGSTPISGNVSITPTLNSCVGSPVNFNITINPTPVITPITDIVDCENVTIPTTSVVVTPSSATVSWTNSNTGIGLAGSGNGNIPTFLSTNNTLAAITGTVTVNATANGCSATPELFDITINQVPVADPVAAITQCHNSTVNAVNFTSTTPGVVFNWTNSNTNIGLGASGTGNLPSFTTTNPTTSAINGTITVTPTLGTCTGAPITFNIQVNPVPIPTAQNNGPLCPGDALNLTATGLPGSSYAWTGPSAFVSGVQNPTTASVTTNNTGNYTVTATLAGCSGTASTNLTVNPNISPSITQVGPFCVDAGLVTLQTSISGGTWSGPGIVNPATGQFSPSLAAVGNNTITYTINAPCALPATTTIVINPLPTVQFSAPVLSGCEPFTAVFTDNSVPASSSVNWDFGDGSTGTLVGTISHTFSDPGCYDITLTSTSAAGCLATATLNNYICVNPYADAAFSVDNPVHSIMNPEYEMTNNSSDANSYSWDFGDGTSSSIVNPTHEYASTPGTYTIILAANNSFNCPDTAYLTVVIEDVLIFHVPNSFTPDGDEFNNMFTPVFYSGFDPQSYTLLIYDRWGEILFESHDVEQGWNGTYHDGIVKEGAYVWTIKFKDSTSDKKRTYTGHVTLLK